MRASQLLSQWTSKFRAECAALPQSIHFYTPAFDGQGHYLDKSFAQLPSQFWNTRSIPDSTRAKDEARAAIYENAKISDHLYGVIVRAETYPPALEDKNYRVSWIEVRKLINSPDPTQEVKRHECKTQGLLASYHAQRTVTE